MLELGTFGSMPGVPGNGYPYRNPRPIAAVGEWPLIALLGFYKIANRPHGDVMSGRQSVHNFLSINRSGHTRVNLV